MNKTEIEILEEMSMRDMRFGIPWTNFERNLSLVKKVPVNLFVTSSYDIIIDVSIIVPDKVVEVTFADQTKEKAVCREPDVFSLEQAIAICISKKVMGGSSKYNKAVKAGMKVYENKLKKEADEKEEKRRKAAKRIKRKIEKGHRLLKLADEETKRLQAEREEMIEIQKETYVRAMKEINNEGERQ